MRLLMVAAFVAGAFASSSAFAQSTYVHHTFCLQTGSSKECAFDSMAQCEASKHSNSDTCVLNSAPENH